MTPAVFLDRDGTLIHDAHYLADPAGVRLLPGAAEAVARLNAAGIPVVVVTNQSGIGRGYFTEADFRAVQARVEELLAAQGARVDAVYHCPHAPDAAPPCDCRKPLPGLFLRAAREHGLDPARSWYVGDRLRDVEPAERLGGRGILVRAGAEHGEAERAPPHVAVVEGLREAAELVLNGELPFGGRQHGPRVRDVGPKGRDPNSSIVGGSTPLQTVVSSATEPQPDPAPAGARPNRPSKLLN